MTNEAGLEFEHLTAKSKKGPLSEYNCIYNTAVLRHREYLRGTEVLRFLIDDPRNRLEYWIYRVTKENQTPNI